jgi:hypothetical protein
MSSSTYAYHLYVANSKENTFDYFYNISKNHQTHLPSLSSPKYVYLYHNTSIAAGQVKSDQLQKGTR